MVSFFFQLFLIFFFKKINIFINNLVDILIGYKGGVEFKSSPKFCPFRIRDCYNIWLYIMYVGSKMNRYK